VKYPHPFVQCNTHKCKLVISWHGMRRGDPATARVARGQAPRLHICPGETRRCVVDGFTPSRPLRSLAATPHPVPLSSRLWGLAPSRPLRSLGSLPPNVPLSSQHWGSCYAAPTLVAHRLLRSLESHTTNHPFKKDHLVA
jgi:hypothetical protein